MSAIGRAADASLFSSCPALPPSLKLRRPRTEKARRSLGVDGCRASTSLLLLEQQDVDGRDDAWGGGAALPSTVHRPAGQPMADMANEG